MNTQEYIDANGSLTPTEVATTVAKKIGVGDAAAYYIKTGPDIFYDPANVLHASRGLTSREYGMSPWKFIRVHPDTYKSYALFIKTRNQAYLRAAIKNKDMGPHAN